MLHVSTALRLMCVLAHPDDESLGVGGTLAYYAQQGVETYVVTATRGERGRFGDRGESPGPEVVGQVRETELRAAASALGVREVHLLGYEDGSLDQVAAAEAIGAIVTHVRRIRPQVVLTFDPYGAYGHPDHIAVSQFTTAAIACAADASFGERGGSEGPHRVAKLYYMAWPAAKWDAYQAALKTLAVTVDGVSRVASPWPDWAVTTVIDTSACWQTTWRAVCCHETQMSIYGGLASLPPDRHRALWGTQEFYRVLSSVNGGRDRETDVFEGLR